MVRDTLYESENSKLHLKAVLKLFYIVSLERERERERVSE